MQRHSVSSVSNFVLLIRGLGAIVSSHGFWIFALSLFFVWMDVYASTLFGMNAGESFSSYFSFSPAHPERLSGISLLTYPLVHMSFEHWASTAVLWMALALSIDKRVGGRGLIKQVLLLLFYAVVSLLMALSFLLPWAPHAGDADLVLGLSAVVFFQLGLLLLLRPPIYVWFLAPVMVYATFFLSEGSALSRWGHSAGLLLGLIVGVVCRAIPGGQERVRLPVVLM